MGIIAACALGCALARWNVALLLLAIPFAGAWLDRDGQTQGVIGGVLGAALLCLVLAPPLFLMPGPGSVHGTTLEMFGAVVMLLVVMILAGCGCCIVVGTTCAAILIVSRIFVGDLIGWVHRGAVARGTSREVAEHPATPREAT